MPDRAASLCAQLLSTDRVGPGRGYPRDLRARVARHVLSQRERGVPLGALVRELGVPSTTVLRWCRVFEEEPPLLFRPVPLIDDTPRCFTLHGPAGIHLDGLDLGTVIAFRQRLAL